MELNDKVKEVLTNKNRINILSTANKNGETDVAVFGSALLTEKNTVSFVLKETSRSLANIKENPYASCLVLLPAAGAKGFQVKGHRFYLKMNFMERSRNPVYLQERAGGETVGWEKSFNVDRKAKDTEKSKPNAYVVIFDIIETRPIVDAGKKSE
ncbi:MAG: pyridoxamine 5'-phosphate oxidase family protein [Deltaproteobacteria bacterium]|nr:pyridoxamine 5'-phosphate oxidase family protein [Deltaproteobacteria bacterium]